MGDDVKDSGRVGMTNDFTDPEVLYRKLLDTIRKYRPTTDLSAIEHAYLLAKEAHGSQVRKSGEPYIIHPIAVAETLIQLNMDCDTVCAGLLHDVIEDTDSNRHVINE